MACTQHESISMHLCVYEVFGECISHYEYVSSFWHTSSIAYSNNNMIMTHRWPTRRFPFEYSTNLIKAKSPPFIHLKPTRTFTNSDRRFSCPKTGFSTTIAAGVRVVCVCLCFLKLLRQSTHIIYTTFTCSAEERSFLWWCWQLILLYIGFIVFNPDKSHRNVYIRNSRIYSKLYH